ncbi:histone-lysine N-methyltransferase set1-like [Calliphora vicina]|uniref:histone-lysine N-methyltransferase set1-like n=1 Tax=Calliphora vicina TaxID=7373 RepID=UPI00325A7DD1
MSSHSGTIGRKRGGSGSGGSEYYFTGGEHAIRRQRSAEWHSRHAYNSSSEDEYQNTGQASAFDTQLLAQLLLQSQQLANLDRYNSDFENEEHLSSRLNEYPSSSHRDASLNANASQSYLQHLQQESTELCSPLKQTSTANMHTPTTVPTTTTTANNKFLNNANLGFLPTTTRSTNPFLNPKYDSQSNSDSLSDRISFSGSSAILDRLQNATDFVTGNATAVQSVMNNAFLMPASSTANSLNPNSTRAHRSKSGRAGGNRGTSGMTSSSSATSSNSNATLSNANSRNERDKFKLQQLQMELREFSESNIESSNASMLNGVGVSGINGELDELHMSGGEETEPPPEPAPPEIPPRTQSLLMSLRKHSEYKLKYEEKGDQKHEEFIPTSQLQQIQQQPQVHQQQQKDYLIADTTVRCSESQSKSIASNSDTQSQQGCI